MQKFFSNISPLFIVIVSIVFNFFGDWMSGNFAKTVSLKYIVFAMTLYSISSFLFIMMLFSEKVSIANTLRNTASVVSAVMLGLFVFHEKLNGSQIVGIAFCIIGVTILQFYSK